MYANRRGALGYRGDTDRGKTGERINRGGGFYGHKRGIS